MLVLGLCVGGAPWWQIRADRARLPCGFPAVCLMFRGAVVCTPQCWEIAPQADAVRRRLGFFVVVGSA